LKLTVLCPAKLNLFLSVGPPDRRGYHPVRTIFQAVSLFDLLHLEVVDRDSFESNVALPERNTVTRCRDLLREVIELPPLAIRLEKRIPSESGLGGGSSDAAGLIRAATRFGDPGSSAELRSVAEAVGADVPFFLVGGRARGEGYGEKLTPLPDPPAEHYVIVKPTQGVSTAEAYRALDRQPREWLDWPERDTLYNDFERTAPCASLEAIERLQVFGARDAGLTGSGSAVFGRFDSPESAQAAMEQATTEGLGISFAAASLRRIFQVFDSKA
jgi:4-diphosphocytidyl-2-C-methyl-D-erythritol kinase